MASRKGLARDNEQKHSNRNGLAAGSGAAAPRTDALLFTTMCIIGLPVDVHAKDGSVYSGIFHTASLDNDYAIVLKKARMVKKGDREANVLNGSLIETLVVQSKDLVQVVAKGILLPSNGIMGNVGGDGVVGHYGCLDRDVKEVKANAAKGQRKHKNQKRFLAKRENNVPGGTASNALNWMGGASQEHNGRSGATKFVKVEASQNSSHLERQVADDGSQEIQSNSPNSPQLEAERTANDVQDSNLSSASCESQSNADVNILEDRNTPQKPKIASPGRSGPEDQVRVTSEETECTVASPTNISGPTVSISNIHNRSLPNTSSNNFLPLPQENSSFKNSAKESKLNPGAKVFSPMLHYKAMTPPPMQSGGTVSYMPDTYAMRPITGAEQEVDASSFARSLTPAKFVPCSNVANGNGGNDVPYVQPITGQVVNRAQPVRYAGQYHNLQAGAAYVHPSPQSVMLGRVGPLVCMHPILNDALQSVAGFSPATTRPHLTPHQMYLPKHQGNVPAPALQLCMTPPVIASGPQPFVMPSSIAVSPPLFPVLRPIAVPGTNGFLGTKFA